MIAAIAARMLALSALELVPASGITFAGKLICARVVRLPAVIITLPAVSMTWSAVTSPPTSTTAPVRPLKLDTPPLPEERRGPALSARLPGDRPRPERRLPPGKGPARDQDR